MSISTHYKGMIIEESLGDKSILRELKIIQTKVENVTERHKTPWLKRWTLHTVEVPSREAQVLADRISRALDAEHAWYANFKNDHFHYIIFRDKVFKVDRRSKTQYEKVNRYGEGLGIPSYQLDFSPEIK